MAGAATGKLFREAKQAKSARGCEIVVPENTPVSGVRNMLRDASLQDLTQIERVLPQIERKRRLKCVD